MSRGALKELTRATSWKFAVMITDVPRSERRQISKIYENYVDVLGGSP